jgi:hypothetical protein
MRRTNKENLLTGISKVNVQKVEVQKKVHKESTKEELVALGIEPGTFCTSSRRDNYYTMQRKMKTQ